MLKFLYLLAIYFVSILPALGLVIWYASRKQVPAQSIIKAAALGALMAAPISLIGFFWLGPIIAQWPGSFRAAGHAFILAGFLEEAGKLLGVLVAINYIARKMEASFSIFGVAVAFGFAAAEQAFFASVASNVSWQIWGIRSIGTLPIHLSFGWMMGRMLSLKKRELGFFLALFLPTLLHGLVDWPLLWLDEILKSSK